MCAHRRAGPSHPLWAALLLLCCCFQLAACDSASPELSPFPSPASTRAIAESESVDAAATNIPPLVTATPAPPITPITAPPAGKFLFVEIWYDASGSGSLPRQAIEFPTYLFDSAKGTLSPTTYSRGRPIAVHPGDWGLLGTGSLRSGSAGSGLGNGLERLTALPFTTTVTLATGRAGDSGEATRRAVVTLRGADGNGRLEAVIDGERVVLAPGASWQRKLAVNLSTATHNGQYNLASSLTNRGWLDQARIQSAP